MCLGTHAPSPKTSRPIHDEELHAESAPAGDGQDGGGSAAASKKRRREPEGGAAQGAAASPKSPGKESSPYVGVCRSRSETTPWKAQIWHDGRTHFLGSYVDEEDAARAYDAGARRLRGENAKGLNFPKPAASPKQRKPAAAAAGGSGPRSSRYAGVTLKAGRWQAQIWHEGKQHHLGTFAEVTPTPPPLFTFASLTPVPPGVLQEEQAARAFDSAARRMRGEQAVGLNFPKQPGPWTEAECAQLKLLVDREGAGQWELKAAALGTGRTAYAVQSRWQVAKGVKVDNRRKGDWDREELRQLAELVRKHGTGASPKDPLSSWQGKADALGTNRTANALRIKYGEMTGTRSTSPGAEELFGAAVPQLFRGAPPPKKKTNKAAAAAAAPSGGEGDRPKASRKDWSEEELGRLAGLVRESGPGDWERKAQILGAPPTVFVAITRPRAPSCALGDSCDVVLDAQGPDGRRSLCRANGAPRRTATHRRSACPRPSDPAPPRHHQPQQRQRRQLPPPLRSKPHQHPIWDLGFRCSDDLKKCRMFEQEHRPVLRHVRHLVHDGRGRSVRAAGPGAGGVALRRLPRHSRARVRNFSGKVREAGRGQPEEAPGLLAGANPACVHPSQSMRIMRQADGGRCCGLQKRFSEPAVKAMEAFFLQNHYPTLEECAVRHTKPATILSLPLPLSLPSLLCFRFRVV